MKLQLLTVLALSSCVFAAESTAKFEYKLLATSKTSTMEKEMNEAASAGYVMHAVMGGETAFGGKETVVVMGKTSETGGGGPKRYKLLATNKTSTMEKELNEAGAAGFSFKGVTVFESAFGGREVAVILEKSAEGSQGWSYRLQATSKTSTMEKELKASGGDGFRLQGMCVAKTSFGGAEVVAILARPDGK